MNCDNFSTCHDAIVIGEDNSAIYVHCTQCFKTERIGKDTKGSPEHRAYSEWFKKDFVQPDHPLYYKYAGRKGMRII